VEGGVGRGGADLRTIRQIGIRVVMVLVLVLPLLRRRIALLLLLLLLLLLRLLLLEVPVSWRRRVARRLGPSHCNRSRINKLTLRRMKEERERRGKREVESVRTEQKIVSYAAK